MERSFFYEEATGSVYEKYKSTLPKLGLIIDTPLTIMPKNGLVKRALSLCEHYVACCGIEVVWILCNRNIKANEQINSLKEKLKFHIWIVPEEKFYDLRFMAEIIEKEGINVLQAEVVQTFMKVVYPVAKRLGIPTILEINDIESQWGTKYFSSYDEGLYNFLLKKSSSLADLLVFTNDRDEELAKSIGCKYEKSIIVPNSVSTHSKRIDKTAGEGISIVFIGNMFYPPNKDAISWFLENVFSPSLGDSSMLLHIIGAYPEDFSKYKSWDRVFLHGALDEPYFGEVLYKADIGLSLVKEGSGMKTKNLDYALHKLAIVATREGANGFEKLPGIVVVSYEKHHVVRILQRLAKDVKEIRRMGKSNLNALLIHYSWNKVSKGLVSFIKKSAITKRKVHFRPIWQEEGRLKKSHFSMLKKIGPVKNT